MERTNAIIRKVGSEYCVFSHTGKNLGCSSSEGEAKKRLAEVEYFKNKGSSMEYKDAFTNFAQAVNGNIDPTVVGQEPDPKPRQIVHQSISDKLHRGTIAGQASTKLLDSKHHFPVITSTQAQSSMSRVLRLADCPVWYNGTLAELQKEVHDGIAKLHPDMQLTIALSDGQTPAETSLQSVKDPNDVIKKDLVPQVPAPTITTAQAVELCKNNDVRKTFGGRLMEVIDSQLDNVKQAKKLAQDIIDGGLSSDQFETLSTYIQQNVLSELMMSSSTAASYQEDRRLTLINKMNENKKNG